MVLGRDNAPVAIPVSLCFNRFSIMLTESPCSYEKELNRGARPAFRLITAQDASAGLHMILCVSGITWSDGGIGDDGLPLVPHPTLELTDGWYRLRTQVDEVLARAARRGVIRVGRKISVSGASVRFRFLSLPQKKRSSTNIASAQHRTLRGVRGLRQSRTQHCGKWNPSCAMARQAWLPVASGYSHTSFSLARRRNCTLSRAGGGQGMHTFVVVQGTRPDCFRHIGVSCCLHRVSQGQ